MKQFKNSCYYISESGDVLNINTNKLLKVTKLNRRYYKVGLVLERGKQSHYSIHRLVAECYVPNPYNLDQVNHKDGDRTNNYFSNLEWCTASYNVQHSHSHGLCNPRKGEKSNLVKLTTEQIYDIKELYKKGNISQYELADKFNVKQPAISRIINNVRWKHLNERK